MAFPRGPAVALTPEGGQYQGPEVGCGVDWPTRPSDVGETGWTAGSSWKAFGNLRKVLVDPRGL